MSDLSIHLHSEQKDRSPLERLTTKLIKFAWILIFLISQSNMHNYIATMRGPAEGQK